MRKILTYIVIVGVGFLIYSSVSASEVLCTFSTTASSTGCAPLAQNNFVAFAPSANPSTGTYNAVQSVALSAAGATSIRYTTDGTAPTCASGTVYATPISVKKTQTIKAISCYPQNTQSAVSSFEYLLSIFDASIENATLGTASVGKAALPTQTTSVRLSNTTSLDVSSSVSSSTAGNITIGGVSKILANFTSGNLVSVDLSAPVTVGSIPVSVSKAVAIQSGVVGQPVLLSNQDFSSVHISIPDGASVLAPTNWNGMIAPPKSGSSAGSAPSGFTVGSAIVEVGSNTEVLLFDKPVSVVLSGVVGAVGYKASGSTTWNRIVNGCGGDYDAPSAPVFPGECYISNGTDTKVYTYHLTSFASLDSVSSESAMPRGGNGPAGFGAPTTAGDMNGDGTVDIFDFNILFAVWGVGSTSGPFYAGADLNRDGKVDILDFNMLMLNWK